MSSFTNEPAHEKTNNLYLQPGPTQTGLHKHRRWQKAGKFGFRKKRNCTIRVAKTKALISFAVTAKLICAFVFPYANSWFSHAKAQIIENFHGPLDSWLITSLFEYSVLKPQSTAKVMRFFLQSLILATLFLGKSPRADYQSLVHISLTTDSD